MIYTQQEKQKMDALLKAFRDYVACNPYFDIVYSEKVGFLRICVGESADQIYFPIKGYTDMLQMFVNDFLQEEEERVDHGLCRDYDHVRSLLFPILDNLGKDREYALFIMEQQFADCRQRCEQMRLERLSMIRETEELLEDLRRSVEV